MHIVEGVHEEGGVVVEGCDGHLKTHGPKLTGLDPPCQPLQNHLHKQWDDLEGEGGENGRTREGEGKREESREIKGRDTVFPLGLF